MKFAYAAIPVIVLGVSAVFLSGSSETAPKDGVMENLSDEQRHWALRIGEVGGKLAYEEFKQAFFSSDFGIQHLNAHIFGEMLYRKLGIDGIAVCDATFAFGCYHSFFGQALAEHGMEAVGRLDKACIEKFGEYGTGCQHGIGHGLLEYFGHQQLVQALEGCKETTQVQKLFGCTSGVFMEYNVPIIVTKDSARTEIRELGDNPYDPCNTVVPEEFRDSCYYEMPQWWDKVYEGDYAVIGELCQDASGSHRESCYLGTGNVAAPSSYYEVEETKNKCAEMPTREGEVLCRAGASWSFFSVPERRELAPLLCDSLGESSHRCVQRSDLIGTGEILQ